MKSFRMWKTERVKIAVAFTSEHLRHGRKSLDGKTRRVKLD